MTGLNYPNFYCLILKVLMLGNSPQGKEDGSIGELALSCCTARRDLGLVSPPTSHEPYQIYPKRRQAIWRDSSDIGRTE